MSDRAPLPSRLREGQGEGSGRHETTHLPLSVAIVCKDNARTIRDVLQSVAPIAAEIVALDSGSTDDTIDILREFNATVHHIQWQGMVRTRQMAIEACAQAWVLCLDSDEPLTDELRTSITDAITRDAPAVAAYELNRKVWWAGEPLHHAWQPEWRLRLIRRGCARAAGADPHDRIEVVPLAEREPDAPRAIRIDRLRGDLRHDAFADAADCFARQAAHSRVAAESLAAQGQTTSALRLITSPVGAWLKQMVFRRAFLDGWRGCLAATATALATAMKHAMLLEKTKRK